MKFNKATLGKRKPLWLALSNLFLDTELQDYDLSYIAQSMKESGYSLDEIYAILMTEVLPVCISNMYSVAGEWAGFDEEPLIREIMNLKRSNLLQRWFYKRNFRMIKEDWAAVVYIFHADNS